MCVKFICAGVNVTRAGVNLMRAGVNHACICETHAGEHVFVVLMRVYMYLWNSSGCVCVCVKLTREGVNLMHTSFTHTHLF